MTTLGALAGHRIVPVLVIDDVAVAVDLGSALVAGGIHCAEVTLRTPAGLHAIAAMSRVSGLVVGAGTVLDSAQARRAADAGARFLVSPGLDPAVVEAARALGLGVLPGAATATELQRAVGLGFDAIKLFPADLLGGAAAVRAFAGPFPDLGVVPSGGVTAQNAREYLALPTVHAVSGSWMADRAMIARRDWVAIERASREAAALESAP
jgi:2-dehydro-3-deoxyphosphogluconate aldolase/(4S)-4-hydroxy-2-oxoglutarate aldolase